MALNFVKEINLAEIPGSIVDSIHIINEPSNKLIRYYILDGLQQEDINTQISMSNYDDLNWGDKQKRISLHNISKIGFKTFPKMGAIAYFQECENNKNKILRPVNHQRKSSVAPTLAMITNDNNTTFNITNPKNITYDFYRIVIIYVNGLVKDYVANTTTLTIPLLNMDEVSELYCIGYMGEANNISEKSNDIKQDEISG